jgi:hypothetical protein
MWPVAGGGMCETGLVLEFYSYMGLADARPSLWTVFAPMTHLLLHVQHGVRTGSWMTLAAKIGNWSEHLMRCQDRMRRVQAH